MAEDETVGVYSEALHGPSCDVASVSSVAARSDAIQRGNVLHEKSAKYVGECYSTRPG